MERLQVRAGSWLVFALVLLQLILPPVACVAQQLQLNPQDRDPLEIYRQAGITSDQEAKIRTITKEFEEAAKARFHVAQKLFGQLRQLTLVPDPNEKAVLAKQAEINQLQAEAANDRMTLLLKIRTMLNKEQKEKLVKIEKSLEQAHASGTH